MLTNYLKIAWRNLMGAKGYAFINITGLAVGMASSMLIFLWIRHELTFDRFYPKTGRLFQVYNEDKINGEMFVWGSTPSVLTPALKQEYPEIENATRYLPVGLLLSANDKHIQVDGNFADPAFLDMFDFAFLYGNKTRALSDQNGIILTKSLAEKLFGTADVIGKTIRIERKDNFIVTGILEDFPANSSFKNIGYVLPWQYLETLGWTNGDWNNNNFYTYVLLNEKAEPAVVNRKISKATASHLKGVLSDVSNRQIFLHGADKWHLYSRQENGKLVGGQIVTVRLFGFIAAFALLIACFNFVNLSTARSEKRAKEVGIRKVAGAPRTALVFQFISESVILALCSGLVAFLIVFTSLPAFNALLGSQIVVQVGSVYFWVAAVGYVFLTGVLAGIYPAFFLSGFQPVTVIKGTFRSVNSVFSTRKGLVVLQFTFAIVLIISTLVIRQQIGHAQKRDSGYDKTNLLFTQLTGDLQQHYNIVQQELVSGGAAISVSKSIGPITRLNTRHWGVSWPGSTQKDKDIEFVPFGADFDFLKTNGVKLIAGRDIDVRKFPTDSTALMLNEAAVKTMRLKDPLGTTVKFSGKEWHVVGVVKDFIFASPYETVNPVLISGPAYDLSWASLRLNPQNTPARNLEIAQAIFKKYNPEYPFEYTFADESYRAKFADEQRTGRLTGLFTGLTILISCLGLFGLAAYSASQRTKEIGVRKVLGASVVSIIQLLSSEFVRLVCVSFLIAAPIAWYAMDQWLQGYQYRISISIAVFAVTGLLSVLIVLTTVSFQAVKAALMNPVESLRSE